MLSKAVILATLSVTLVAATPLENGYKCNTGPIQCCEQVQESQSIEGSKILAIVDLDAEGLTGMVGKDCNPISAVGIGGGTPCNSQQVCCENNSFNGLVVIGCTPVDGVL